MNVSQQCQRPSRRVHGLRLATVLTGAVMLASSGTAAHALQIGDIVEKAWWNVNGANCAGTALAPDNGGNRAVESLSKLEVLAQVGQRKAKLHLNTNTFYDPGASQAAYLYPILFGRSAACWEIATYVERSQWQVFRELACSPEVSSSWRSRLALFCALPNELLWGNRFGIYRPGNQPSPLYESMLGDQLNGNGCPTSASASSEERLYWPKLKAKYGKNGSLIGDFTVFFDAITIDVGVSQQRVFDPGIVASAVTFWNNIAWYAVSKGWPVMLVTGRNGTNIFDIDFYRAWFTTPDVFALPGTMPKTYPQHRADQLALSCAGNPGAKAALDPFDLAGGASADGALRNLFDELANEPQGTDVICTAKGICGNLFDFAKAIYAQPNHGKPLIKSWILTLIRG
jgi:hypothetical protein